MYMPYSGMFLKVEIFVKVLKIPEINNLISYTVWRPIRDVYANTCKFLRNIQKCEPFELFPL